MKIHQVLLTSVLALSAVTAVASPEPAGRVRESSPVVASPEPAGRVRESSPVVDVRGPRIELNVNGLRPVIGVRRGDRFESSCPSYDFGVFLRVFTHNPRVQNKFTRLPRSLNANPAFPIWGNGDDGVSMNYQLLNQHRARVVVESNANLAATAYYFEKRACWQLVGAENLG